PTPSAILAKASLMNIALGVLSGGALKNMTIVESSIDKSYATAVADIRVFLGEEKMRALHQPNPVADAGTIVGLYALSLSVLFACFHTDDWFLLITLAIAQGVVFQLFGLVNHEFFVHRKVGGRFSYPLSVVFAAPIQLSATRYADAHRAHHKYVGGSDDAEAYKTDLDTRTKKLLFTTAVGTKLAASGKMGVGRAPYFKLRRPTEIVKRRAALERGIAIALTVGALMATLFHPIPMLFGYILPVVVVLPFLNAIRILIEHADVQRGNPYAVASRFRCGVMEDILFLCDSGEYHLIHHFLPNVPFYRMREARRALNPFFDEKGVIKTSGWPRLLFDWFVQNKKHGDWWGFDRSRQAASRT
ncbi:MAG: fatty acid desaturase, partial [Pseudomonadota bacterium]